MRIRIPEIPTGYQPESSTFERSEPVRTVAEHWRTILAVVVLGGLSLWRINAYNEHQRDMRVSSWAEQIRERLEDPSKLLPGERFYPQVTVTSADRTWFERSFIEQVNVRESPSVYSGDPIGTVFPGALINNVVVVTGEQRDSRWGAFLCTDIIQWAKPPLTFDSLGNRICTIDVDFLQKVGADGSINYGNGVISPSNADRQRADQPTTPSK